MVVAVVVRSHARYAVFRRFHPEHSLPYIIVKRWRCSAENVVLFDDRYYDSDDNDAVVVDNGNDVYDDAVSNSADYYERRNNGIGAFHSRIEFLAKVQVCVYAISL